MGYVATLLRVVPGWFWLVLGIGLWGGDGWLRLSHLKKEVQAERNRQLEEQSRLIAEHRQAEGEARTITESIDHDLQQARQARDLAVRSADQRLRDTAAAWASSASSAAQPACRSDGAPATALLRGETRQDLVELAQDADAVASRLLALQRWVRDVAPLCRGLGKAGDPPLDAVGK